MRLAGLGIGSMNGTFIEEGKAAEGVFIPRCFPPVSSGDQAH